MPPRPCAWNTHSANRSGCDPASAAIAGLRGAGRQAAGALLPIESRSWSAAGALSWAGGWARAAALGPLVAMPAYLVVYVLAGWDTRVAPGIPCAPGPSIPRPDGGGAARSCSDRTVRRGRVTPRPVWVRRCSGRARARSGSGCRPRAGSSRPEDSAGQARRGGDRGSRRPACAARCHHRPPRRARAGRRGGPHRDVGGRSGARYRRIRPGREGCRGHRLRGIGQRGGRARGTRDPSGEGQHPRASHAHGRGRPGTEIATQQLVQRFERVFAPGVLAVTGLVIVLAPLWGLPLRESFSAP